MRNARRGAVRQRDEEGFHEARRPDHQPAGDGRGLFRADDE